MNFYKGNMIFFTFNTGILCILKQFKTAKTEKPSSG